MGLGIISTHSGAVETEIVEIKITDIMYVKLKW